MTRFVNIALLTIMLIGAIVTYNMKLKAEKAAEQVAELQDAVEKEKEAIQLLRAELSMLLQPGRLQAVVERHADYFKLEDLSPSQYTTVEDIPFRPVGPPDEHAITEMIDESSDAFDRRAGEVR